ncbi:hypothetical protein YC2023_050315 [Brassica napus]
MRGDTSCLVDPPRAWSIHLVLLHVRLHVQLPCTMTPRASVDTQLVRWFTPRSEPMQRATSSFSVHWSDFGHSETSIIPKLGFPSNFEFSRRASIPSCLVPKHPSDQSKALSNHGLVAFLTLVASQRVTTTTTMAVTG